MKGEKLKTNYLELAHNLFRLFDTRKDITKRFLDNEFEPCGDKRHLKDYKEKLKHIKEMIKNTEMALAQIAEEAAHSGILIPFEIMAQEHKLTNEEKYILLLIFFEEAETNRPGMKGRDLLMLLGYKPGQFIEKSKFFENLLSKSLIEIADYDASTMLFEAEFALSVNVLKRITGDEELIFDETQDETPGRLGRFLKKRRRVALLEVHKPLLTFDQIVLDVDKKREIRRALYHAKNLHTIFEKWGFEETIKYGKGITMLFYGPPGTGKTATCEAIAHRLRKKIGIANYANLLGAYVGDSEKHVALVFEQAKKDDCVLVFDEADALFAARFYETYSTDRMHNFMTNILMQELERFEGVVILTTNREVVMDEAFNRRILLKLKFDIPRAAERTKIWRALIPAKTPLAEDVDFEKLGKRYELTGGEIKNAILNAAVDCASKHQKKLTMSALMEFAAKETEKMKGRTQKHLGFIPDYKIHRLGY